ncbi:uncharacterized protein LOC124777577 [Schistocerca piceifrons]|uniref:uncharacterized protein LOC124777577 n=1 Tax=Schistocerca piceifrons TaxID=274613 RepID=UPI001F5F9DBB|nr:uncharacterized protein LOC124777577 [Schistocerca piceifrons]XP_047108989.1 uncharacterized protein LOC124777577 [Schistocerca piceifrons]
MGTVPDEQKAIPSWLDRAFIVSALKCGDPTVDESSVQLKSMGQVGGGLLSETYRVVAQLHSLGESHERETSVIVKSSPTVGGFIKELADSGVFTKETVAYGSFLPAMDSALETIEGESWRPLAPKFYHHGSQPTSFLVVEDLDASGFHKVAQGVSLDVDQCRAVLRNLARMHAASVTLLDDQQYNEKLFHQSLIFSRRLVDTFQDKNQRYVDFTFDFLEDYTWFQKYVHKMEKLSTRFVREVVDVVEQCQVDFKVMVHGDLHKNNVMFREDSDGLQVRFYDFQGIHIGSPAEDLQYFFHTSASLEVMRDHTQGLLADYHAVLQCTLRTLGLQRQADGYPLEQLLRDMDHFGMIAVFVSFTMLPFMLNFGEMEFAIDTSDDQFEVKSKKFYEKSWRNDRYLAYLQHLLPVFDSKGLLDQKV